MCHCMWRQLGAIPTIHVIGQCHRRGSPACLSIDWATDLGGSSPACNSASLKFSMKVRSCEALKLKAGTTCLFLPVRLNCQMLLCSSHLTDEELPTYFAWVSPTNVLHHLLYRVIDLAKAVI